MPCTYDESPEEKAQNARDRADNLKKELDLATRLLCELCFGLENSKKPKLTGELREWWERHRIMDKERRHREDGERKKKALELEKQIAHLSKELEKLK